MEVDYERNESVVTSTTVNAATTVQGDDNRILSVVQIFEPQNSSEPKEQQFGEPNLRSQLNTSMNLAAIIFHQEL